MGGGIRMMGVGLRCWGWIGLRYVVSCWGSRTIHDSNNVIFIFLFHSLVLLTHRIDLTAENA